MNHQPAAQVRRLFPLLSLRAGLAYGVGICFRCVARVRSADGWGYRRVCTDAPIFDAVCLAWDE